MSKLSFPLLLSLVFLLGACAPKGGEAPTNIAPEGELPTDQASFGEGKTDKATIGIFIDDRFTCSGILVDKDLVLTASHCLDELEPNARIQISFERTMFEPKRDETRMRRVVAFGIANPLDPVTRFPAYNYLRDIAWARFEGEIDPAFKPVRPWDPAKPIDPSKAKIYFSGFGRKQMDSEIFGRKKFTAGRLDSIYNSGRFQGVIRADFSKARQKPCRGDSGGPLFIEDSGELFVIGVVSGINWMVNTKNDDMSRFDMSSACRGGDTSFTSVPYYKDWIAASLSSPTPSAPPEFTSVWPKDVPRTGATYRDWCLSEDLTIEQAKTLNMIAETTGVPSCDLPPNTHTVINLKGRSVRDASPIASYPGATELDLSENQILVYPRFEDMTALKKLDLTKVGLKGFDMRLPPNLESLKIAMNNLGPTLPAVIKRAQTLQVLEVSKTGLTTLVGIESLGQLKSLRAVENRISEIDPIGGLGQLEQLELGENRISDIGPLANLKALKILAIGLNQIHDLSPVAHLNALERLSVFGNPLESDKCPMADPNHRICSDW